MAESQSVVSESSQCVHILDLLAAELFHRIQFTQSLAITPHVQLVINVAPNSKDDSIFIVGLRTRLAL